MTDLIEMGKRAKQASFELAQITTHQKNQALQTIAEQLILQQAQILQANAQDIAQAKQKGVNEALLDRLQLTPQRLQAIADDVRKVIALTDPVGKIIDGEQLDSGLKIERVRVPIGVIGTIYESRPNVTIDVATLCLKTGNAVILRGGKETAQTNAILVEVVQQALINAGLPQYAVQAITQPDRELIIQLLKLDQYVDMIIPRGGAGLHQLCKEHSTIPVVVGGIGVCHLFVEQSADQEKALTVIDNAKTQRCSTCNTLETLLIQANIAKEFLPKLTQHLAGRVRFHAQGEVLALLQQLNAPVVELQETELYQEWLSLDLNIVIVADLTAAITHIRQYGSQHSEGILTQNPQLATAFIQQVDAAAVYVNASTRFTDGAQFGLGAEVAVSTQKLHARGPMGLESLTTYKWVCSGDYLTRS